MLNPCPSFWDNVHTGAVLCYKCYNTGWRQKKSGGNGRPPDYECKPTTNGMHEQNHVSGENAPDGDDHARPPNHHIADEPRGRLTANRGDDRTSSGCIGSNAIDTDHNDNDFPELPSSSKRRRCAKQLQQGCQRRRDKGTSIDGTPDFTDARDDNCQQKSATARIATPRVLVWKKIWEAQRKPKLVQP